MDQGDGDFERRSRNMRRCVEIQVKGLRLRGTFHPPTTRQDSLQSQETVAGKTGVLLFNSGFLPRSAQGDLLAHLADRIAAAGFPAFRFDLPGLGDSEGNLPEDAVTFVRSVEKGNFAPYASSLAAKLVRLHGLEKVVVGGLCGGGITALFGAAASKGSRIGGVLMLDPIFNLVQVQEPQSQKKSRASRWKESCLIRMKAVYEELRIWILSQPLSAPLQKIYGRMKAARNSRRTTGARPLSQSLPKEANLKLIQSFERLLAAHLPMLVITAQNPRRVGESFDYLEFILKNGRGRVDCRKIEGTNHSFLEGNGPKAVQEVTDEWLKTNFAAGQSARLQSVKETARGKTMEMALSIE
jgi:pimeloyl-ACP methyl ester carboxylesterase